MTRNDRDWTGQWVRALTLIGASVLLVGYNLSNGQWHPRVIHDESGRPILFTELVPPPKTFGGVTLGMTPGELLRARGEPLRRDPNDWIYYSIDSAHDGVLDVYFTEGANGHPATVWAIQFFGKPEAAPPGIANLSAFTRQDLMMRYGSPTSERADEGNTAWLYFQNRLMIRLDAAGKVTTYGVYTPPP